MDKNNDRQANRSTAWKIVALTFILIECNLAGGSIFGFASLFPVLQRYGVYRSECVAPSVPITSNQTKTIVRNCQGQMAQYQLAFTMGIAFFNLPAVLLGMINDAFGARSLKLIGILFHLISWLSLWLITPGYDWLLHVHTIFLALAGICTLLASFSIAAHFQQIRGLISTFISGAQLSGSIWYGIFQVLIDREVISLPHLALVWAFLSVVMLINAFLFFDFRWPCAQSSSTSKPAREKVMKANGSHNTFIHHLTSPLFILVALFLSFLLLSIAYLPITWFPWLMYLTKDDVQRSTAYTFMYNMSAALGLIIAPVCGLLVDYKIARGYQQKLLNISILQSLTWTLTVTLCIVCMFQSINAALAAMVIMLFSRTMLVAGSQALIITVFPGQYIGSLIGAVWTTAGVISFALYGLTRLASHPTQAWRSWTVILCLCLVMFCHLIQLWRLYVKANKEKKSLPLPRTEEELEILN